MAFDYLDADKSGAISATELKSKLGNNISEKVYQEMMVKFDADGNGTVGLGLCVDLSGGVSGDDEGGYEVTVI